MGDATFNPNEMFPEIVNDKKLYLRNSCKDMSSGLLKFNVGSTINLNDIETMQITAYTKASANSIKSNMTDLYLQNIEWGQKDEHLSSTPIASAERKLNKGDVVIEDVGHGVNKVTWNLDSKKFLELYDSNHPASFLMQSNGTNEITYLSSEYSPKNSSDAPRLDITSIPEPDLVSLIGSAGMILLLTNRKRQVT